MCLLTYSFAGANSLYYLLFAFSGTICSYNFHWYLTGADENAVGRARWSIEHKKLHLVLFVLGLIGAAIAFFHLHEYWDWLAVAALLTFLYSAPMIPFPSFRWLKEVAVGKTAFLAFAWTHVTVNIPIVLAGNSWTTEHYMFSINRFFFIFSICILFDYRDRDGDYKLGIRSLITQITEKGVNVIYWFTQALVVATGLSLLIWMSWIYVAILLAPTIILCIWYNYFKRSNADFIFYFLLDGFMMISGAVILLWLYFGEGLPSPFTH
jgi:4-hydroxybenzoate polyprenyltransferase